MYVRRWPRTSASSRTPPSDSRTNLRFSDFAMLFARDVLPTPGRAREAQDRALRLRDELAHGEELEDALLDLLEAEVVLVQDLLGALDVLRISRVAFFQGTVTSQSM